MNMILLQVDTVGIMQYLNLGGLGMLIVAGYLAIKWLIKRNDALNEKLDASNQQRETRWMEMMKAQNDQHLSCEEKHYEMSEKWAVVVDKNTEAMTRLGDKIDRIKA